MTPKEVFQKLAAQGVRIFSLSLQMQRHNSIFLIHPDKTTEQWRADVRAFKDNSTFTDEESAESVVYNKFLQHMMKLGYVEIEDVVADVFEGKVATMSAKLIDEPVHWDQQEDGFGHYGWESK